MKERWQSFMEGSKSKLRHIWHAGPSHTGLRCCRSLTLPSCCSVSFFKTTGWTDSSHQQHLNEYSYTDFMTVLSFCSKFQNPELQIFRLIKRIPWGQSRMYFKNDTKKVLWPNRFHHQIFLYLYKNTQTHLTVLCVDLTNSPNTKTVKVLDRTIMLERNEKPNKYHKNKWKKNCTTL